MTVTNACTKGGVRLPEVKYPYAQRATRYARDVVSGAVPSCRYVRLACQRHLDDLKSRASSPWKWDAAAAERVCRFASEMVHVKGEWAGKKIRLEDWQCFMLGVPFGWKMRETGLRRFSEVYAEIPRKNAKSTTAATIGLYMFCADNEPGAEVYSGATSEKQALEVFRPAWLMVEKNKLFKNFYGIELSGTAKNPGPIYRISDGSRFEAVVHNPGDGASPSCGIVDEYHEHKDSGLYDTFATGMGARRQPMQIVITTAGTNTSAPCFARRKHAVDVLEGTRTDDSLFTIVYTIDEGADWVNFDTWKAANPNYGVSVYDHYLRKRHLQAKQSVGERNIILCKHLNVWSNAGCSAFDMAAWSRCESPGLSMKDYAGCPAYVGVDLASKVDIAALVFLIKGPEHWAIFCKSYLPESTVEKAENAHYRQFVADGWLTVTPGVRTDFSTIEYDLKEAAGVLDIKLLGYDPREATYLTTSIAEWAGFDLVEIPQGPSQMSEPMKELEALIAAKELRHQGDACFTWQIGNTIKKQAKGGGPVKSYYPTKEAETNKIDAAVASIMAVKMAHAETVEETAMQAFIDLEAL